MSVSPGARLGPYEVVSALGAGGMGEVYRARDTRLGRDVAIKVLPEHLAARPEVRARFEREARAVSALNHPNICTLHDIGREGEVDFLVLELVEGETLARRLDRGPLPFAEILRLGAQITDALDRAHRAGIVHRDLKPGNVMLAKSGAKLMDFGLARSTGNAVPAGLGGDVGETIGATAQVTSASHPLTAAGTIVGTFQYMAPEQLEGNEADARSDLCALGCVLYEMATGRKAFEGKSQASLIGAILHANPAPISSLSTMTPPALDRLVNACLAKDPADRIQNAHDVKLQLSWLAEAAGAAAESAASPSAARRRLGRASSAAFGAIAGAGVVATAMTLLSGRGGLEEGKVQRVALATFELQPRSAPMLIPDGSGVVFSGRDGASTRLFRRAFDSFDIEPIEGTEAATAPFFSPDGAWIGFMTPDAIKRVPIGGGVARTVAGNVSANSADWAPDGSIYFTWFLGGPDGLSALSRVPCEGGTPDLLAEIDTTAHEFEAWLPEVLPDGKTVLITVFCAGSPAAKVIAIRDDGSRQEVAADAALSRVFSSGHFVYFDMDAQAVFAAPFDLAEARMDGAAVPLTEVASPTFCFDALETGELVYVPTTGAERKEEVVWIDRQGSVTATPVPRDNWGQPRVSPDGRGVLVRRVSTSCEFWMLDSATNAFYRLTQGNDYHDPIWSPDGRFVAFRQMNTGGSISVMNVGGARDARVVSSESAVETPAAWFADERGDRLLFTRVGRTTQTDIWSRSLDGSSPSEEYLATEFREDSPVISVDGRWVAYVSNESGMTEVFVRPYPNSGRSWQISNGGGDLPVWSRDGRELYFTSGSKMMAASIETQPDFRASTPVPLFEGGFGSARDRDFDVSSDGRFIAVQPSSGDGTTSVRYLSNWPEVMRRNAGTQAPRPHS